MTQQIYLEFNAWSISLLFSCMIVQIKPKVMFSQFIPFGHISKLHPISTILKFL